MSSICSVDSTIDKATTLRLLSSCRTQPTFVSLQDTSAEYQLIEHLLDPRLLLCSHTFRVASIELRHTSPDNCHAFKRLVESNGHIHLLFHGTNESNHENIFENGFNLEEHKGKTDEGYIGIGVYLSPNPEYATSYIDKMPGIVRFQYEDPVGEGVTCKLLGCLSYVGATRRLFRMNYGSEIEDFLDSRWSWVTRNGEIADRNDYKFAVEYVIKESISVLPTFRVSLQKITREVIWLDPNIDNSENSGYVRELKQSQIYLFATTSQEKALKVLQKKKEGTQYRAITSGSGGEDLVRKLRRDHCIMCKVMVFCTSVDYHKTWARNYGNVKVTRSPKEMKMFATWKD